MFRCNSKILFVTSSFVGWLIGHILFMKWIGLILSWIHKNDFIRGFVWEVRSPFDISSSAKNSRRENTETKG